MITIKYKKTNGEEATEIIYTGYTTKIEYDSKGDANQVVRNSFGESVASYQADAVINVELTPPFISKMPAPAHTAFPWRFTNQLKTRLGTDRQVIAWFEHPQHEGDARRGHAEAQANAEITYRALKMHNALYDIAIDAVNIFTYLAMNAANKDDRAYFEHRVAEIRELLFSVQ
ncbi:MAG TPA: hypothetical protein VIE65_12770 [Methylobacter sp.]|jgi:hypothetical protein